MWGYVWSNNGTLYNQPGQDSCDTNNDAAPIDDDNNNHTSWYQNN